MKLLLRRNVYKLGKIGEIVDVKAGFARNYLLPQRLAIEPTAGNVKRVEAEKAAYLEELAKQRQELQAKAAVIQGKEITISARANEQGQLYGSVGPAQIVAVLANENIFIEAKSIELAHPIRQLDKYDVTVRFDEEVTATIHVWVVPLREPGEELEEKAQSADAETPADEAPADDETQAQ